MIEFCNRRRMILSTIVLGILTVIVLVVEEAFTSSGNILLGDTTKPLGHANSTGQHTEIQSIDDKRQGCWLYEEFIITNQCSVCSDSELLNKNPVACLQTGMKESVHCKTTGIVHRSCNRLSNSEHRTFWIFESVMLLSIVISYGVVQMRWSQLERLAVKNIELRLAAGH